MYVDLGFGSMLFQALAAALIACGAYGIACRRGLRKYFHKLQEEDSKITPPPDPNPKNRPPRIDTDENGFLK